MPPSPNKTGLRIIGEHGLSLKRSLNKKCIDMNMFRRLFKKKMTKSNIEKYIDTSKCKEIDDSFSHLKIASIDLDEDSISHLTNSGFKVSLGTLGKLVNAPEPNFHFPGRYNDFRPGYWFPDNIHESDILIINLDSYSIVEYEQNKKLISNLIFEVNPKVNIFNPRPFNSRVLEDTLHSKNNDSIVLIFATSAHTQRYIGRLNEQTGTQSQDFGEFNIYSFAGNSYYKMPQPKSGEHIEVCEKRKEFNSLFTLLEKFLKGTRYNQIFNKWIIRSKEDFELKYAPNYIPLLKNNSGDIVSFMEIRNNSYWLFLPQIKKKGEFLESFLKDVASTLLKNVFPEHSLHQWKEKPEYWLPNHKELIDGRKQIDKEYKKQIEENQKKILQNKAKFSFLHDILTETGDDLVEAIIKYLHWIGFEKAIDADKIKGENGLLEEDIQIELEDGLLIIECKGIGGTSTDAECSQISKIKYRRAEARGKLDVSALYIVNHQRHLPPLQRTNPPFKPEQIKDAELEKRGLLSTWKLFNLYFDIEAGIITKEEATKSFLEYGLVEFKPLNLIKIGEPEEIFKDGKVCIIDELDIELNRGDTIFVEKGDRFNKTIIKEIQVNGKPVEKVEAGEVGLELDIQIKKNSVLWKKEN